MPTAEGRITVERYYLIKCGRCANSDRQPAYNKAVAMQLYRSEGWKETKAHGWICRYCAREPRAVPLYEIEVLPPPRRGDQAANLPDQQT